MGTALRSLLSRAIAPGWYPLICAAQRVGFLHRFGPKTAIDFVHLGMESGMALTNKRVRKKEKSTN